MRLRHRHAHRHPEPLTQRAGGDLDSRRQANFRMPRRLAVPLTKALDLAERQIVAGEMEQRVEQHGAVSCGENEAVAIEPVRIRWIVAQKPVPKHVRHGGRAQRQSGMPGMRLLDRVDRKEADGVDTELVQFSAAACSGEPSARTTSRRGGIGLRKQWRARESDLELMHDHLPGSIGLRLRWELPAECRPLYRMRGMEFGYRFPGIYERRLGCSAPSEQLFGRNDLAPSPAHFFEEGGCQFCIQVPDRVFDHRHSISTVEQASARSGHADLRHHAVEHDLRLAKPRQQKLSVGIGEDVELSFFNHDLLISRRGREVPRRRGSGS